MTYPMFRDDAYLSQAPGQIERITQDGGLVLDQSVFYPTSGGQTGDSGQVIAGDLTVDIATTVKGEGDEIVLVPTPDQTLPQPGAEITQHLNWPRRLIMMRLHSALHLLSVVIPLPVTGGQITPEKGRLDFDMPDAPEDKLALETQLNKIIGQDHPITDDWITDAELDANPGLVKTMSVQPPRGSGRIRLVRIGTTDVQID